MATITSRQSISGMQTRQLGNTHLRVAPIALGTAHLGSTITQESAFALLDHYAERGGNFLDTAHIYAAWLPRGWGASERTIGHWLHSRQARKDIILATKGGHPPIDDPLHSRLRPEDIRQDLHESLERLNTTYIDLYWLHTDDPAVPVGELLDALNGEIHAGLIRTFGCSNWTVNRQRAAQAYAEAHRQKGFCASQIAWSLARWNQGRLSEGCLEMSAEMYAWHLESSLPVLAYTSQAHGFFSGRYEPRQTPRTEREHDVALSFFNDENFRRLIVAGRIAAATQTTPNQVALAWLRHHPFQVIPIIGPNQLEQLENSLGADALQLDSAQLDELAAEY